MDLVTGRTAPGSGKVLFDGKDITGKSVSEISRKYKIGRKFQGPNVFDNMTVRENGEMIKKLKGKHTLVVVEHDMDFVRQVAEYVTVFNCGRLLTEGPLEQVRKNPEVVAVYLKED